ncbi:MAG TPA: response regulator transcription factor [Prolixibacteraceae bacterium]|nr:response regulator transcription factor [Prolixibacteraceae bacterium]
MSEITGKILVVDDERDLCEIIQFNLESEGFEVDTAYSAEEALSLPLHLYHLVILDVMMGAMSGYKLADYIRKELKLEVPIIFLTAKTTENDLLTGYNVGGDDYIRKPFSIREVVVRCKALLKRGPTNPESLIRIDTLKIDMIRKKVSIDNQKVELTKKEFDILTLLLTNPGRYLSREYILKQVWHDDVVVTDRNVDVNIARLRKKIGEYGSFIKGKSGYGYLFEKM